MSVRGRLGECGVVLAIVGATACGTQHGSFFVVDANQLDGQPTKFDQLEFIWGDLQALTPIDKTALWTRSVDEPASSDQMFVRIESASDTYPLASQLVLRPPPLLTTMTYQVPATEQIGSELVVVARAPDAQGVEAVVGVGELSTFMLDDRPHVYTIQLDPPPDPSDFEIWGTATTSESASCVRLATGGITKFFVRADDPDCDGFLDSGSDRDCQPTMFCAPSAADALLPECSSTDACDASDDDPAGSHCRPGRCWNHLDGSGAIASCGQATSFCVAPDVCTTCDIGSASEADVDSCIAQTVPPSYICDVPLGTSCGSAEVPMLPVGYGSACGSAVGVALDAAGDDSDTMYPVVSGGSNSTAPCVAKYVPGASLSGFTGTEDVLYETPANPALSIAATTFTARYQARNGPCVAITCTATAAPANMCQ